MVQKYLKGYLSKKHTYKRLMTLKVNSCYDFFTKIKLEREMHARMIIRYWCLKHFCKLKAKKLAEIARKKALAAKKAEDEKKRRGKYGYAPPKKKAPPKKPTSKPKPDLGATQTSKLAELESTITQPVIEGVEDQQENEEGVDQQIEGRLEDKEDVNTEPGEDLEQREEGEEFEADNVEGTSQQHEQA